MLLLSLRTILAGTLLCGVLVAGVVVVSSLSATTLATGLHENESEIYTMYAEDTSRHFRLWLAGTRCFKPLPPWVYAQEEEPMQAAPDIGRSFAQDDDWGEDIVTRLSCRRWLLSGAQSAPSQTMRQAP
jgi:hypothetical protein